MRWAGVGLVTLLLPGPVAVASQPGLEIDPAGHCVLRGLPPILETQEVARQLTTGLTTTFAFRIDLLQTRGGKGAGGARVDIRYALWDEVFHVTTLGLDGELRQEVIPTLEALRAWWRRLRLAVLDLRALGTAAGRQVRVTLDVVPFSHSEQLDAQRWLAESISRDEPGRATGRSPEDGDESLAQVLGVLIATSIQRRALTTYRWTLDLPAASSAPVEPRR